MGTSDDRPHWQREHCPPWCVVLHGQDDHERDRKHVSASLSVPVHQLLAEVGPAVSPFAEPEVTEVPGGVERTAQVDLAVALHRRDGAATTWLYVGDGAEQSLELTVESWARLVPALERALDRARP
ncbi:DUF6907 domain-containing protein [Cellulomonas endometrii]|uniref:DUF6907 domain-containing protein n=1 Tax=Cellulomonas endometrii TaxID=3036301 RepID=UPI0024AE4F08|nr:hypothetical protein [Cellulomonas endometrii]